MAPHQPGDTMSAKVFQYGTGKMPRLIPDPMFFQLRKQNEFWNCLVELDKDFTGQYYAVLSGIDESVADKETAIERLQEELATLAPMVGKSRSKGRGACDPATKTRVKELRAEIRAEKSELKAARKEAKAKADEPLKGLRDTRKAAIKAKRQEVAADGLYWCNYNAILDSFQNGCNCRHVQAEEGHASRDEVS